MNDHERTEAWRDALGDLAAPPHLLDDVLEAVRSEAAPTGRRPSGAAVPWLRWGALAATLLAAVGGVMWLNGPGDDGAEGPRVTFSACASAEAIDRLRADAHAHVRQWLTNPLLRPTESMPWAFAASSRSANEVRELPLGGDPAGPTVPFVTTKLVSTGGHFAAPSAPTVGLPTTSVRSVVRLGTGWDVVRQWTASALAAEEAIVLGEQLLARFRERAGADAVLAWQRSGVAYVELATDEPEPLRLRVSVATQPGHDGSLVLTEALARALRMHQFQLPGAIELRTVSSDGPREAPRACFRAWLRVQVPELGFDEGLEVAVEPPEWPSLASTPGDEPERFGVHLTGEPVLSGWTWGTGRTTGDSDVRRGAPVRGSDPDGLTLVPRPPEQGGGVDAVMEGPGAARLALYFADGAGLFLPDIEVGGRSGSTPTQSIERTTVRLPGEPVAPGTRVVLAEVWRGGEAIAGPAGICVTRVAEDGTVSWLHTPWADPDNLRIAVVQDDRVVRFIDGAQGPRPPARRRR